VLAGEAGAEPQPPAEGGAPEAESVAKRVFQSEDPAAAYGQLSPAEREKLRAVMTPGPAEIVEEKIVGAPPTTLRAFNGCWAVHATARRKAAAGNTLYTYWQTTRVCARKGKVTNISVYEAGGETSTPGWRIDKKPDRSVRNVGWEGRGLALYHFVLGAGPWDIQTPTDCLQLRLNADGRHHRSMGSCDKEAR
jgi:hypothetical protein